jgi:hypothetical protein
MLMPQFELKQDCSYVRFVARVVRRNQRLELYDGNPSEILLEPAAGKRDINESFKIYHICD